MKRTTYGEQSIFTAACTAGATAVCKEAVAVENATVLHLLLSYQGSLEFSKLTLRSRL